MGNARADRDRRQPRGASESDRDRAVLTRAAPPSRTPRPRARRDAVLRPRAAGAAARREYERGAAAAPLDPRAPLVRDGPRSARGPVRAVARRAAGPPARDGRDDPRPWLP